MKRKLMTMLAVLLVCISTWCFPDELHAGACEPPTSPYIEVMWVQDGLQIEHCSGIETAAVYMRAPLGNQWYYVGTRGVRGTITLPRAGDDNFIPRAGGELLVWSGDAEIGRMTIPWPTRVSLPMIHRK